MPSDATSVASPFIPASILLEDIGVWPSDLVENDGGPNILDRIGIRDVGITDTYEQTTARFTIVFQDELSFSFPGLSVIALVFGGNGSSSEFPIEVDLREPAQVRFVEVSMALRFADNILKPVREKDGRFEIDPSQRYVEIALSGSIIVDVDGIRIEGMNQLSLSPCMISDSGIVIEASSVVLDLSTDSSIPQAEAAGLSQSWRGVFFEEAAIHLPPELGSAVPSELSFQDCFIGSGGFTGLIEADWNPGFSGSIGGVTFSLLRFALELQQNSLVRTEVRGMLTLPFFDEPVEVDIGLNLDGGFSAKLASAGSNGLYKLTKENILELELDSIGFEIKEGVFTAKLSGELTPLFGKDQGLKWPSFKVNELAIDSEGHVKFDGGWMNLPDQYSLDFHGFKIEITQLGFGKTDDGGKWIGFSGGLKLVDGFSAGASVEGLRITWYDDDPAKTRITLNGVGVEFEVPNVVRFKGDVSYRELEVITPTGAKEIVHRFDGDIELNLISLDLKVDATLVIGSATGLQGAYTFFAIYVDVELPNGIPLAATGVALYGFAGLFALQMEPDKHADEEWYEGWFKRPDLGVTDLKKKWVNRRDSLAFGAGVTIGTLSDNGFTFAGRMLLVIVFPGPIILIEGKANLLKERAKLGEGEPTFRSLAVIDNREKTLLIGLDAFYRTDEAKGTLIDIRGGTEAFFDFKDASRWHIYVGEREPRDKRIRAKIFQLFEANSYFMIDSHQLATGAWLGYSKAYQFGPLKVSLEAWIEGNAIVSWKPVYFHGDLWMHGSAELSVFGFGLGLSADARFAADVFDPFHVVGELSVGIKVPLRKKRLEADLRFEWGPRPGRPPLPLPLKEISIEHFKVTTTWPLERGKLLLPNYDPNGDGFLDAVTANNQESAGPPSGLPIVPMDCRPHISFGRTVHDKALIGVNAQPVDPPEERIGDPAKNEGPASIRYSLDEIALSKWNDPGWQLVARKSTNANPAGVRTLFGSWAPVPCLPAGDVTPGSDPPVSNSKLWLWSLTPFDYTRHSGDDLNNWFLTHFPNYPCIPKLSDRVICCDFERIEPTQPIRSPLKCVDHPEISIEWLATGFTVGRILEQPLVGDQAPLGPIPQQRTRGDFITVTILKEAIGGLTHALRFPRAAPRPVLAAASVSLEGTGPGESDEIARAEIGSGPIGGNNVTIRLSEPADRVTVLVAQEHLTPATCVRFRDFQPDTGSNPRVEKGARFEARDINGQLLQETRIDAAVTTQGPVMGLKCEQQLEITLPCPSAFVQLTLTHYQVNQPGLGQVPQSGPPIAIQALNDDGTEAQTKVASGPERTPEAIRLKGRAITRVVVRMITGPFALHEAFLHELWFDCSGAASIFATGFDDQNKAYGPFAAKDHVVEVSGKDIKLVQLQSEGEICIVQICATMPPPPAEVEEREEMAQHMTDELVRWSDQGTVLEPHTTYRLKVVTSVQERGDFSSDNQQTEFAYFRTGGPPGLAALTPTGPSNTKEFDSGLDDLTRYVRQTTPATVPAPGQKPVLAKPFYRAFDVGVDFNENYVDLMYRMDGRDMGLYLYDNNNRPARDCEGRLIIVNNAWGTAEELILTDSEMRWVKLVNKRKCDPAASIDVSLIPRNKRLTAAAEGQVLDADTLYEARLVPLLLREIFSDYAIGGSADGPVGSIGLWSVIDTGVTGGPSHWEVREEGDPPGRFIVQTSNIAGGEGVDLSSPGTLFVRANRRELPANHPDQPSNWTDYRVSAYLRSPSAGVSGIVVRYVGSDQYYHFSIDRERKNRRLARVLKGMQTVLAEDSFEYQPNRDYLITLEATGTTLRVYQDGALVFKVDDASIARGGIGLYCSGNPGARFGDVRVDDLRKEAPTAYRFKFLTSRFSDFFHHIHSFQDETWTVELTSIKGMKTLVDRAVSLTMPPSEDEARAYETLADKVLGPVARQNPDRVEVTRVQQNGETLILLVRSPEPIEQARTQLEVLHGPRETPKSSLPGAVKLTDVTFGATQPNEESVTLLLRETTDLTGYRIEYLFSPVTIVDQAANNTAARLTVSNKPVWKLFYTFGNESQKMPAGTRVRVYSGNAADMPALERGLVTRFTAQGADRGELRLQSGGVELRLVPPGSASEHQRYFLPADDYKPAGAKVLRNADGTAFFIIVPAQNSAGSSLTTGHYNLKMTYHRDNRAADPHSRVFSKAGDSSDEHAEIDVHV